MNFAGRLLKAMGWSVDISVPDYPKCIICVAPHTSNLDFIMGELAYASVGRKAGFLMKSTWFLWPLGPLFRALGGIPVYRGDKKRGSLTEQLVERFREANRLVLAITPEGTRSRTDHWHTGFLHIARLADVPVLLGVLDFGTKRIIIDTEFEPTGNVVADINSVKDYYAPYTGKYPENFSTKHTEE